MNRILQAEVILTLTAEQARLLVCMVDDEADRADDYGDTSSFRRFDALLSVLRQQCARQGVQL